MGDVRKMSVKEGDNFQRTMGTVAADRGGTERSRALAGGPGRTERPLYWDITRMRRAHVRIRRCDVPLSENIRS
jgi:hypothetical protein